MQSKCLLHFLVAMIIVATLSLTASAAPKTKKKKEKSTAKSVSVDIDPRHRPEDKLINVNSGYLIWYTPTDRKWRLIWKTEAKSRTFQGTLRITGGEMRSCRTIGLDYGLRKRAKKKGVVQSNDAWRLNKERTELVFLSKSTKGAEGFEFKLSPAGDSQPRLMFDIKMSDRIRPQVVFIGRNGAHPATVPFSLEQPNDSKAKSEKD